MIRQGKGAGLLVTLRWWRQLTMHLCRFETVPFPTNHARSPLTP